MDMSVEWNMFFLFYLCKLYSGSGVFPRQEGDFVHSRNISLPSGCARNNIGQITAVDIGEFSYCFLNVHIYSLMFLHIFV